MATGASASSAGDGRGASARPCARALFQQLATGRCIDAHQNLLIPGPCGVGKIWLACALGQKACRDSKSALYHRLPRLFGSLVKADLLSSTTGGRSG